MRNRKWLALAAPLIALIFATAGPASAAPEQRVKLSESVQHLARYDGPKKIKHAHRHKKAGVVGQKHRKGARAHSQGWRNKVRSDNRSPNAWRNIHKRPGQALHKKHGKSGKNWTHGKLNRSHHGQPGKWRGASGGHHMKGIPRHHADRFQRKAWQHQRHGR